MEKLLSKISNLILIATIASSYLLWTAGLNTATMMNFYSHYEYSLLISLMVILLLNIKKLDKIDFLLIGASGSIFIFYTLTSSIRHSNRFINASIMVIVLLILCYRKTNFDKIDFGILGVIITAFFGITLYRIFTELPKIVAPHSIWQRGNEFDSIWINSNTIGASVLFMVMMLSIIIKQASGSLIKWLIIPVYAAGIAAIWVCQAKTAFAVLILFIVLDNLLPKRFIKSNWLWLGLFSLVLIVFPFIFYYCANLSTIKIFSGRENLWKEFFDFWFVNKQNILIGMKPYVFHWKNLGMHNSYLSILNNLGILGYTLFSFFIFGQFYFMRKKGSYSTTQISLAIAFLCVFVLSTMEDILVSYHWIPLAFSFFGILIQKNGSYLNNEQDLSRRNKSRKQRS
ncbi:hypothetical protein A5881_002888 [Enterococcus termitis]